MSESVSQSVRGCQQGPDCSSFGEQQGQSQEYSARAGWVRGHWSKGWLELHVPHEDDSTTPGWESLQHLTAPYSVTPVSLGLVYFGLILTAQPARPLPAPRDTGALRRLPSPHRLTAWAPAATRPPTQARAAPARPARRPWAAPSGSRT